MTTIPATDLTKAQQKIVNQAAVDTAVANARAAQATAGQAEAQLAATQAPPPSGLVPDLSKVAPGLLDVRGGPAPRGSVLAERAIGKAATTIAADIGRTLAASAEVSILVTSDADLITSDSVFHDVDSGLDQLLALSGSLMAHLEPTAEPRENLIGSAIGSAAASIIPPLLSFFATTRTVTTSVVSVDDLSAAAAMMGALKQVMGSARIVHDDFRLLPSAGVYSKLGSLIADRDELVQRHLRLTGAGTASGDLAGSIKALLQTIDSFTTAIREVPKGDTRSPLAVSAAREQLHAGSPQPFTHVLLVKGSAGESEDVTSHRAALSKDRFVSVVDISITYVLIPAGGDDGNPGIVASGTVAASAIARGDVGSANLDMEVKVWP